MNDIAIRHDAQRQRFEAEIEGHATRLEYRLRDDALAITHTEVPEAIGGRGIAGKLVQAAVDFAQAQGLEIDPQCAYAQAWMRRHPHRSGAGS
jgi:predicted GNAT family acetyltransferase